MNKKSKSLVQEFRLEIAILIAGLIAMHLIFISGAFWGSTVQPDRAGQFGDFVGGYIGTWFLLLSVVLLFATLRRQHQDSRDRELETRHQKFETMFFQLLAFHRSNVAEMKLEVRNPLISIQLNSRRLPFKAPQTRRFR